MGSVFYNENITDITMSISKYINIDISIADKVDEYNGTGITVDIRHTENSAGGRYEFTYEFAEDIYKDHTTRDRNRDILDITRYENSVLNVVSSYMCEYYRILLMHAYLKPNKK
jgi:hypothetical protein